MSLFLDDGDVRLYHGDCLDVLRELPDRSVHMCATSPPFYGLRDYGVQGQIGLEETPDMWVARLVAVFREVRRVLRDDGTLWVEIGDSYSSGNREGHGTRVGYKQATNLGTIGHDYRPPMPDGIKQKDMLGQPWMLAFALRADGWYLRSEIIWARPNPMPESVTDRPTKAHSTVFLLSKQPRYFYDADAIREEYAGPVEVRQGRVGAYQNRAMNGLGDGTTPTRVLTRPTPQVETLGDLPPEAPRGPDGRRVTAVKGQENSEQHRDGERWPNPGGANARSVWSISTEPTPFAHFATWPQALVRRMIRAGTSEKGCCPECGAPWVRDTSKKLVATRGSVGAHDGQGARVDPMDAGSQWNHSGGVYGRYEVATLGWRPSCDHDHDPVPCVVLDPFAGSGTTLKVARDHVRHAVGIELNEDYCHIAADRLAQQSLLTGDAA